MFWEDNGKTIVSNGQALCPTCHTLKTKKDRLRKIDKKRTSSKKPKNYSGINFDNIYKI